MDLREQRGVRLGHDLGARIRERREALGLTLRAAGAKAGLSHAYIGSIERGRDVAASPETLAKLAYALQLPPETLGLSAPEADLGHLPVKQQRHAAALRRVVSALRRLEQLGAQVAAGQAAAAAEAASSPAGEDTAKLELLATDLEADAQDEEQALIDRYRTLQDAVVAVRAHHDDYY